MTDQPGLFDAVPTQPAFPDDAPATSWALPPVAHTDDLWTSHTAAASVDRHSLCLLLLSHYAHAPLADLEAAAAAGLTGEQAKKRCSDLRNLGHIEPATDDNGQVITRRNATGRSAMVCRITAAGRQALHDSTQG